MTDGDCNGYRQYGARALLAEDVETNALIICNQLRKFGLEADIAKNGAIALDMAKDTSYDIIFMDLEMPKMDGAQATSAIRLYEKECSAAQNVPIIALTAHTSHTSRKRCACAGMNDMLSKPLKPDALQSVLDKWLGGKAMHTHDKMNQGLYKADAPASSFAFDSSFLDSVAEDAPHDVAVYARAAIKDMEKRVHAMHQALSSNKLDEAAGYAHAMKSVAMDVGFQGFSEMATEIEDLCRIGDNIDHAKTLGECMVKTFPNIQRILKSYID